MITTTQRRPMATALALAAGIAFSLGANAQTNVQIFGVLDAGLEYSKSGVGSESFTKLNTGNQWASRLGFRATEDLGQGLKAIAVLEAGVFVDDGSIVTYGEPKAPFFGRRSIVGLQSAQWGELLLGRDYTSAWYSLFLTDRFRYGLPGTVSTPSQNVVSRTNGGAYYTSPKFGDLQVRLGVAASDKATNVNRGTFVAGNIEYSTPTLFATLGAQKRKEPGSKPNTGVSEYGGGIEWRPAPYVLNVGFWNTNPVTTVASAVDRSKAFWVGGGMAVSATGRFDAQFTHTRVDVIGRPARGKALTWGINYTHTLSKSTALYAGIGGVRNNENARLALNSGSQRTGGVVFGADPRSVIMGMRHQF